MSSAAPAAPTPIPALAPTVKLLSSGDVVAAAEEDEVAVGMGGAVVEAEGGEMEGIVELPIGVAVAFAGFTPADVAVGSNPLVHLMAPPAELGRLAKAGSAEAPCRRVDEQYGSQLACGSFSSVVWLASTLHPPHIVSSLPVPGWHCWMATHSCSWNRRDFQGHARALNPASVQPARYVFPAIRRH